MPDRRWPPEPYGQSCAFLNCNRKYALLLVASTVSLAGYSLIRRAVQPPPTPQHYGWRTTAAADSAATGGGGGSNSCADGPVNDAGGAVEAVAVAAAAASTIGGRSDRVPAAAAAGATHGNVGRPAVSGDTGPGASRLRGGGGGGAADSGGGGSEDPFLHNREYRALIDCGNICQTDRLFLIVLVCSRPESGARRDALRRTWASVRAHRGQAVRTAFVLGRAASEAVQASVSAEAAAWGDVLQVDVDESYRNLTLKTLLGLRFALAACRDAPFVMKTDDDVVAHYRNLVDYLLGLSVAGARHLYAGSVHRDTRPVRDPADKWYVSVAEYARSLYPPYAGGSGYVLSMAAAALVDRASTAFRYLSMEDAFVGVCAERAGLAALHDIAFQGYWFRASECRMRALFTSHGWLPEEMEDAWRLMLPFETGADADDVGDDRGALRPTVVPPSPGYNRACPPLEWLLYYYDESDDEVDRKYREEAEDESAAAEGDAVANVADVTDGDVDTDGL